MELGSEATGKGWALKRNKRGGVELAGQDRTGVEGARRGAGGRRGYLGVEKGWEGVGVVGAAGWGC